MNSAIKEWYTAYFNPKNYHFEDVLETLKIAYSYHSWVSVNYFVFPGLTDSLREFDAFSKLLDSGMINMIQWRNFNIDPDWYTDKIGMTNAEECMGMQALLDTIRRRYPRLAYGYFNPSLEVMKEYRP